FDYPKTHVLGEAANVVVCLDGGRGAGAALDHIRVQRSLGQKLCSRDTIGSFFENPYKLFADDFTLLLGVCHARQPLQKSLGGIRRHLRQICAEVPCRKACGRLRDETARRRACGADRPFRPRECWPFLRESGIPAAAPAPYRRGSSSTAGPLPDRRRVYPAQG